MVVKSYQEFRLLPTYSVICSATCTKKDPFTYRAITIEWLYVAFGPDREYFARIYEDVSIPDENLSLGLYSSIRTFEQRGIYRYATPFSTVPRDWIFLGSILIKLLICFYTYIVILSIWRTLPKSPLFWQSRRSLLIWFPMWLIFWNFLD